MNSDVVKTAWVVWGNSDLTEGKGSRYPMHICAIEATAIRLSKKKYVQGGDCPIEEVELIKRGVKPFGSLWYGPAYVISATVDDEKHQKNITNRKAAYAKAVAAGLTDEDIIALRVK